MVGRLELSIECSARRVLLGSAGARSRTFFKNNCARFWILSARNFLAWWDRSACFRWNSLSMSSLRTALHSSGVIAPVSNLCSRSRMNLRGNKDLKSFGTWNSPKCLRCLNHTPANPAGQVKLKAICVPIINCQK